MFLILDDLAPSREDCRANGVRSESPDSNVDLDEQG